MPRAKKSTQAEASPVSPIGSRKVRPSDQWGGFVRLDLSDVDREGYDDWLSSGAAVALPGLVDALAEGLKLTLVWDHANECFIASFTGRPDPAGKVEFTCTLSGRGGDIQQAIDVLIYKHDQVLGTDWRDWLINGVKTKRSFG